VGRRRNDGERKKLIQRQTIKTKKGAAGGKRNQGGLLKRGALESPAQSKKKGSGCVKKQKKRGGTNMEKNEISRDKI